MGSLRGDNGGERPPEGGGLPDLPPEWGTIVIPDDASALEAIAGATLPALNALSLTFVRPPGSDWAGLLQERCTRSLHHIQRLICRSSRWNS